MSETTLENVDLFERPNVDGKDVSVVEGDDKVGFFDFVNLCEIKTFVVFVVRNIFGSI